MGRCTPQKLDDLIKPFTERFAADFSMAHAMSKQGRQSRQRTLDLDAAKSDIERNNYLIHDIIGVFDVQDTCYLDNNLEASIKLIDDLAAHPKGDGKAIGDIRKRSEHGIEIAKAQRQQLVRDSSATRR